MLRSRQPFWTGLDLDGDRLRAVQIKTEGDKRHLTRVMTVPVLDEGGERYSPQLLELITSWRIQDGYIAVCLPRHLTVIKRLKLPTQNRDELRKLAPFEAARFILREPEELVTDVVKIQDFEDGSSEVWLYAVAAADVLGHFRVLHELGLEPDRVVISTQALAQALTLDRETLTPICFIGRNRLDMLIGNHESVDYSRGLDLTEDTRESTNWRDEVFNTIRHSQGVLDSAHHSPLCLVLHDESLRESWASTLQSELVIRDGEPSAAVNINGLAEPVAPYLPAIGAVLAGDRHENLLPQTFKAQKIRRAKIRSTLIATFNILCFVALVTLLADRYLGSLESNLRASRTELNTIATDSSELRSLQQQAQAIAQHLNPSGTPLEIYAGLFEHVPPEISISFMQSAKGRLVLKGQTKSYPKVWELVERLSGQELFADVRVQFATSRQVRNTTVIDFQVDANLSQRGGRP